MGATPAIAIGEFSTTFLSSSAIGIISGALQRFRVEHPREVELLWMSSFLLDYPFATRLFPSAIKVLERLGRRWTDRDPVRR